MKIRIIQPFDDPATGKTTPAGSVVHYTQAKGRWLIENGYGVAADFTGIYAPAAAEEEE